jgi:DNA-binding transcriptional LysR family regulator
MRQVALMLAVDEFGTLGAAAKSIGISQPAASKILNAMEDAFGLQVFDRIGRTLRMNAAGIQVMKSFHGLQGTIEQLQRDINDLRLGRAGHLAIGSIMAASPTYLTLVLAKLKEKFPLISVTIEVGTSDRLMELLDDGTLDMVIGRVPGQNGAYRFTPLSEEPILLVCAINHPLIKVRKPEFKRLTQYPWVLQPEGSPMRDVIVQEFMAHHSPIPAGLLETSSTMITVHIVSRTNMIAALPQSVANGFCKHKMLGLVNYTIGYQIASYGSIVRVDRPLSPQADHLLRMLHVDE